MEYIKTKEIEIFQSCNAENYYQTKNKITGINFFKMFFIHNQSLFTHDNQELLVNEYCNFVDYYMKDQEYLHTSVLISSYLYHAVPVNINQGFFVEDYYQPVEEVTYLQSLNPQNRQLIPLVDPVILLLKLGVLLNTMNVEHPYIALNNAFNHEELMQIQNITAQAHAAADAVESQIVSRLSSPSPQASQHELPTMHNTPPDQMIPHFTIRSMNAITRDRATRNPNAPPPHIDI
jgi:hypothetical protein